MKQEKAHGIVATMPRVDFYRVLGVSREASDDLIKKAYRKLVFEHHPDRHPNSKEAEEKIREINAAYEIIGDAEARRNYDRLNWGDEFAPDVVDVTLLLEEMERKLFDEGRKELFAVLMKDVPRIKAELALIRERVVKDQGYDSFKGNGRPRAGGGGHARIGHRRDGSSQEAACRGRDPDDGLTGSRRPE